jgi:hypothetical protein
MIFQISIAMSLLIANTSIAAAGGGKNGKIIGQVSNSAIKSLPTPTTKELRAWGIMPNATQPVPSGGTATATAGLEWSYITMYSTAKSSLSSNTLGVYNLCARVVRLIMNGVVQGTHSSPVCGDRTGGGVVVDNLL